VSPREQRSESACVPNHGTRQILDSAQGARPPAARPWSRRSWALAAFLAALSVCAITAAPALAAAPETPELHVEGIRATEATFQGQP